MPAASPSIMKVGSMRMERYATCVADSVTGLSRLRASVSRGVSARSRDRIRRIVRIPLDQQTLEHHSILALTVRPVHGRGQITMVMSGEE